MNTPTRIIPTKPGPHLVNPATAPLTALTRLIAVQDHAVLLACAVNPNATSTVLYTMIKDSIRRVKTANESLDTLRDLGVMNGQDLKHYEMLQLAEIELRKTILTNPATNDGILHMLAHDFYLEVVAAVAVHEKATWGTLKEIRSHLTVRESEVAPAPWKIGYSDPEAIMRTVKKRQTKMYRKPTPGTAR